MCGPAVTCAAVAAPPVRELRLVPLEVAGRDEKPRVELRRQRLYDVERDVRDRHLGGRQLVRQGVGSARLDSDAVRARVRERRLDRGIVDVDAVHGREAELRGRDREHARAAANVEQACLVGQFDTAQQARGREFLEQLEAEPRGRVRAGAEGAAGVDHDRREPTRRPLPRRPDPEAVDDDTVVEGAPGVLPAFAHGLGLHDVEPGGRLVGVDGVRAVQLLDALREDVQEERELGLAADDDVPLQPRNMLFSFSYRPSSALYVPSWECDSNSASSRRCSSVRWRGTTTLTRMRWSPRPKPCSTGMPRPRSTTICPGWVPGASSSSSSPSSVSTASVVPSAASVIVRSTFEKMSFASRTKRGSGRTCTWT